MTGSVGALAKSFVSALYSGACLHLPRLWDWDLGGRLRWDVCRTSCVGGVMIRDIWVLVGGGGYKILGLYTCIIRGRSELSWCFGGVVWKHCLSS